MENQLNENEEKIDIQNSAIQQILQPLYLSELKNRKNWMRRWRHISITFDVFSKLAVGTGSILSFVSGYYGNSAFAFSSGCCGVAALTFERFAVYSENQSRKRLEELNKLLVSLKLDPIPDIIPTIHISKEEKEDEENKKLLSV